MIVIMFCKWCIITQYIKYNFQFAEINRYYQHIISAIKIRPLTFHGQAAFYDRR
jgi:hypothetical protein